MFFVIYCGFFWHETLYVGLVMSERYSHSGRSEYLCVDQALASHASSSDSNANGALLYLVEMRDGASDESQYPNGVEISCAQCAVMPSPAPLTFPPPSPAPASPPFVYGAVYTRWGSRTCPTGSNKLFEGFIAGGGTIMMLTTLRKLYWNVGKIELKTDDE